MRLISTLNDPHRGYTLSAYLSHKGITNQLEVVTNTDWSSHEYGSTTCRLWVQDEDRVEEAMQIVREFEVDPENPRFHVPMETSATFQEEQNAINMEPSAVARVREPMGFVTRYILVLCSLLLFIGMLTSPTVTTVPNYLPYEPVLSSPINKSFLYDYPQTYELTDRLVHLYGLDALNNPDTLPAEGKYLVNELLHTPYWEGLYPQLLKHYQKVKTSWDFSAPMFEKERQGEIWRFFSPMFLHNDLFHLFFNMIWLVVLGKQMEQRLGKWKYILFIGIAGLVSNTAQYMMTGPNFIGFSGVLCAMLTFIWFRQKRAAWEGYQLEGGTMAFISLFILLMFTLQAISFFLEAHGNNMIAIGIANTAHLTGAFVGYVLARLNLFAWR